MQLTILGNNGPYPETGGACSGYLICDDACKTHILIDCGTGVLANLRKYVLPRDLDAVILTHLHYDHMSDMLPMIYALQFAPRDMPLPVYLPDSPENVRTLLNVPAYDLRPMDAFQIGDIRISFAPMRHTWKRAACASNAMAARSYSPAIRMKPIRSTRLRRAAIF